MWRGTSQLIKDHRAWASVLVPWRILEDSLWSLGQTTSLDRLFRLQYRDANTSGTKETRKKQEALHCGHAETLSLVPQVQGPA